MKALSLISFLLLTIPGLSQTRDESIIFNRIESLLQAKKEVMDNAWPLASDTVFNIPLIYFTDTTSYVANPPQRFIQQFKPEIKFQSTNLKIYKTTSRIDDLPFHMETWISDVETAYNYNFPFGEVSGLEETRKIIPDLPLEAWSGMILHEVFHGYQFRYPAFWKHAYDTKIIYKAINDSLQSYYDKHPWYKKAVDEENKLILEAIEQKDKKQRRILIDKMFVVRGERRKQVLDKFNRSIDFYEKSFETMEGTARYIEAAVIRNFSTMQLSERLKKSDTNSMINGPSSDPEWAYKTNVSQRYTYAIGYNMARLLDALKVSYKTELFKTPDLTLEDLLRTAVK